MDNLVTKGKLVVADGGKLGRYVRLALNNQYLVVLIGGGNVYEKELPQAAEKQDVVNHLEERGWIFGFEYAVNGTGFELNLKNGYYGVETLDGFRLDKVDFDTATEQLQKAIDACKLLNEVL